MNFKKIILNITLLGIGAGGSACATTMPKAKPNAPVAANVYLTDGYGRVTYSINASTSQVVKIALQLFGHDMKAVTGQEAKEKSGAPIQIYQLDQLTNKEFSALEKLGTPLHQIITKKDAFYIGTRNGRLVIVGSNARGTAYGILEVSRMAGVSPLTDYFDVAPQPRKVLSVKTGYESVQVPAMEYRGLALNSSRWMSLKNYSSMARLMLRLRANALWQADAKHTVAYDKAVVDSFDISIGIGNKIQEMEGKKHKKHKHSLKEVNTLWTDKQIAFQTVSPGILLEELSRGHHADHDAWIADVTDAKASAYSLQLFMDKAWNANSVSTATLKSHFTQWLATLFGTGVGQQLVPIMSEYYHLTNIRRPEYMAMPFGDNEFHSGEFGNELERYLYAYDKLKRRVNDLERNLPDYQKDGYFEMVKHPIYQAALVAEKELEAQEARHIARPGLFANDNEAKAAAALSLDAYGKLRQLGDYYSNIRKGSWRNVLDLQAAFLQAPQLPGTLSTQEIARYKQDAFDRNKDLKPFTPSAVSDIIARNASQWTTTSPAKDGTSATLIPLTGHSNQAVSLPKGASLNYVVNTRLDGDARFTIAALPIYSATKGDVRVSISIDHAEPVICSLKNAYNSTAWKEDLWRGQVLKGFYTTLGKGSHSIEIQALDDHVVLDQWALDMDVDRAYYMIPVE